MECFQLLGVTCMFIASKYEEIYTPELHDFLYLCGVRPLAFGNMSTLQTHSIDGFLAATVGKPVC